MPNNFPTPTFDWTLGLLPNVRITFSTLLAATGAYVTGITNQLIARGMTVAGSSNGTTGAMDAVNRCTTAVGFAVRGANLTTAQSWIVVTHANGCQTCFAFTGATDDICEVSFSPAGLFVAAGTPTHAPTATDKQTFHTATVIGATASADRVFTVWVDSTAKSWRSVIFRSGVMAASFLSVQRIDASLLVSPAVGFVAPATEAMGGFSIAPASVGSLAALTAAYTLNSVGGLCRVVSIVGNLNLQVFMSTEFAVSANGDDGLTFELNGAAPPIRPLTLWSLTTSGRGKLGVLPDVWNTKDPQSVGALTVGLGFVYINNSATVVNSSMLLPWDGVTTTCVVA